MTINYWHLDICVRAKTVGALWFVHGPRVHTRVQSTEHDVCSVTDKIILFLIQILQTQKKKKRGREKMTVSSCDIFACGAPKNASSVNSTTITILPSIFIHPSKRIVNTPSRRYYPDSIPVRRVPRAGK